MNDTDRYILEMIRKYVWSGFYGPNDVHRFIDDMFGRDSNKAMLRASVASEFAKKADAERLWPDETDCDRLDQAFEQLNAMGIIALQNAGNTMSDGHTEVCEELYHRGRAKVKGYCFYHGQDLECAIDGGGLTLAFGGLDDSDAAQAKVGRVVTRVFEHCGFGVNWNGDSNTRIEIPQIEWKRRRSQ